MATGVETTRQTTEAGLYVLSPLPAGKYHDGISYYNGGAFYFGSLTSPVVDPGGPFDHLIASWNAATV